MTKDFRIEAIANNIFSMIDINKKENIKQWTKDKENFEEELFNSIQGLENEKRQKVLLRLEKMTQRPEIFLNKAGTIDVKKVIAKTQEIVAREETLDKVDNKSKEESDKKEEKTQNEKNFEKKIEEILDGSEKYTKNWSKEEKEAYEELVRETEKKLEDIQNRIVELIKEGMSAEEAEKIAKKEFQWSRRDDAVQNSIVASQEAKKARKYADIHREDKNAQKKADELETKAQKEFDVVKIYAQAKAITSKLAEQPENLTEEQQRVYNLAIEIAKNGKVSIEEAIDRVLLGDDQSKSDQILEFRNTVEKNTENYSPAGKQINQKTEEMEENLSVSRRRQDASKTDIDKENIISTLDTFTSILLEAPESIEEIEQKIEELEDPTDEIKRILINLTRDPKLIEALQSEEAMEEYTERLVDIQEQIQENNVELSSELSPSSTNIYALLGISKITDKEMQPMYDASKDRLDVTDKEQSQQHDAPEGLDESAVQSTEVDGIYIVNGVQMEVDEEFTKIAMEAQERGEDPEKAILEYYEQQQENADSERASEDKEEHIEPEIIVVDERGEQVQNQEAAMQDDFFKVAEETGEELQASDKNENIIVIKKDKEGSIQVFRPSSFLKVVKQSEVTFDQVKQEQEALARIVEQGRENDEKSSSSKGNENKSGKYDSLEY